MSVQTFRRILIIYNRPRLTFSCLLALLIIWLCLLTISKASASPSTTNSSQKIYIAASLALTGPLAHIGLAHKRGLELGISEINSAGGINGHELGLIVEDNFADPKAAVAHFRRFASISPTEKRPALLITHFSHIVDAVANIAHQAQIPLLYSASTLTPLKVGPYIYQDYCVSEDGGTHLAEVFNRRGIKRVGFLSENTSSCVGAEAAFKKLFSGTIITEERFNSGSSDFRSSLLRLKTGRPDALIFCAWKDSLNILKQIKELKMQQVPAYFYVAPLSGDTPQLREVFEQVGATSTWYGATQSELTSASATPHQRNFLTNFQTKYKEPPYLPDAAIAYDDIALIEEPLKQCLKPGSMTLDLECFDHQIKSVKIKDGVAGPLDLGEDRATHREIFSIRVKDGEWRREKGES